MEKSRDAFRTISEVAEWLDTPAHVLRFWESRFAQVKPVKRAGGRRYYRPADMQLLGGIKKLLHEDGMTIRGVQKLLREEGVKHVASLSGPIDAADEDDLATSSGDVIEATATVPQPTEPASAESGTEEPDTDPAGDDLHEAQSEPEAAEPDEAPIDLDVPQAPADNVVDLASALHKTDEPELEQAEEPEMAAGADETDPPADPPERDDPEQPSLPMDEPEGTKVEDGAEPADAMPVMAFGRGRPVAEEAPQEPAAPEEQATPSPLGVDIPDDPEDDDPSTAALPLGVALARDLKKHSGASDPQAIAPLFARLKALRDQMDNNRR